MTQNKNARRGSLGNRIGRSGQQAQRLARMAKARKRRDLKAKQAQLQEEQNEWKTKRRIRRQSGGSSSLDEATVRQIEKAQREYDNLQDDIMLSSIYSDMAQVEAGLHKLPTELAELRTQGFVFQSYLENKIDVLDAKWDEICDKIEEEINRERRTLTRDAERAHRLLQQAVNGNQTMLTRAESAIESLEKKANATRNTLRNRYSDLKQNINQTKQQLKKAQWAFQQLAEAKIEFLSAEYLVAACKAKMLDDANDKEGEKGILYLTDERLLFEQKEEVKTKKFFFFTTDSQMVQEVRFAEPLGHIEGLEAQDKGRFIFSKELLNLQLSPQAQMRYVTFELENAKNEEWTALINRVTTNEIERERLADAVEEKQEVSQQVSQAPTICPTCSATLQATIVRGQNSIDCDYCGSVIRL